MDWIDLAQDKDKGRTLVNMAMAIHKARPIKGHEGPEGEQRYSSTFSSTSALDWGGLLTPSPGRFHASIPGPSSPQRVAIPTELSRPTLKIRVPQNSVNFLTR